MSLKLWHDKGLLQREIQLYQDLIRKFGIEVVFVTYVDGSDYKYQNLIGDIGIVPIYDFIKKPSNKFIQILQTIVIPSKLKHVIQTSDIIKTNQVLGAWVASIAKILYKKPLVVRCGYELYDFALKANKKWMYKWFVYLISWASYKSADRIHVATKQDKNFVIDRFKIKPNKIHIFPNWIDTSKYKSFRRVLNKGSILFVGRLNKQKNISLLLKALSGTKVLLDIVGEGNLKNILRKEANELGVTVNFLGSISNDKMPELYNNYKVYVLCSHYEGNPKTLLEAMSCGCAVIGTDVPGIREIIINRENGLLVKGGKYELRDSINELIDSPDLCDQLGSSATKSVVSNNSLTSIFNREINAYRAVLSEHSFRLK